MLLDQHPAQLLVRLGGAEQHAVRHDDGRAAAGLEQAQEQGEEQQLGLLGLDDLQQVLGGVLVVEGAGEGRIGEDQGIVFLVAGVVLGERVRSGCPGFRRRAAACSCCRCAAWWCRSRSRGTCRGGNARAAWHRAGSPGDARAGTRRRRPGSRGAAGGIADHVLGVRRDQLDHQPDDVARRAELAVLPGGGDLAEHVLVEVALGVAILHRHLVEHSTTLASSAGVGMVKRASFMWWA